MDLTRSLNEPLVQSDAVYETQKFWFAQFVTAAVAKTKIKSDYQ